MWSADGDARPRERVLRRGPRGLGDADLVAVVLRTGRSGQSAESLARDLLDRHGGLGALATACPDALANYPGMGPAKAAAIAAAFELGRRTSEHAEAVTLRRAEDVVDVVRREARGIRRDELVAVVTDSANRVRWVVTALTGMVTRHSMPVATVVRAVLAQHGRGFAIARVTTAASPAVLDVDTALAGRFRAAAIYAELRFLDYVVVADTAWRGVLSGVPLDGPPGTPLPSLGGGLVAYETRAGP
jgi:DNA repair protein RadC